MKGPSPIIAGDHDTEFARRVALAGLVAITAIAFYLRFRCLGCLGFRWDEDLTSLAVKALLDKGVPELPSGMVYLRFYPFQWVIAASVETFGFSEFSMRLPAVIFGTVLVPTAYWFAARLFDRKTAVIVAACIALSFWQVEMARTARMYAPFFLSYLLAAAAIYLAHFRNPDRVFSPWVLPLAILALTMHQLAYSLAILLLLAVPLRRSARRTISLIAQAAIIGIAFIATKSIEQKFFELPRAAAKSAEAAETAGGDAGLLGALLQQVSLPDFDLVLQLSNAFPVAVIASLLSVALLSLPLLRLALNSGPTIAALTFVALLCAVLHQFNLVVLALAALLIAINAGVRGVMTPAWYLSALYCLLLFVIWLAVIGAVSVSSPAEIPIVGEGSRKLLRALIDYPNFRLFWSYIIERPMLAVPVAIGTLWGIEKMAGEKTDATALFLVGGFWLILFANGILETKFEFFRYNLHVDPFFLMLVVAGLFAIPDLLARLGISDPGRSMRLKKTRGYTVAVAAIAILGVNPAAALLTSARDYSEPSFPYPLLGMETYDDFKTTAAYVSNHREQGDIILVLDPREFWNYIGEVDYWIRSNDFESQTYSERGRARDLYVGVPVLHTVEEVRAAIAGRSGQNAWLLYSRARVARTPSLTPELRSFLLGLEDRAVYEGRDRQTVVIRITGPLP